MISFVRTNRIRQIATRLLLVFLVLTLSFAWLPQPVAAKSVQAPDATNLAAFLIENTLKVVGTGFAPQAKYQVRVRLTDADPWTKVGSTRANKSGKISFTVALPSSWAYITSLQVCVKEVLTGKVKCTVARR